MVAIGTALIAAGITAPAGAAMAYAGVAMAGVGAVGGMTAFLAPKRRKKRRLQMN